MHYIDRLSDYATRDVASLEASTALWLLSVRRPTLRSVSHYTLQLSLPVGFIVELLMRVSRSVTDMARLSAVIHINQFGRQKYPDSAVNRIRLRSNCRIPGSGVRRNFVPRTPLKISLLSVSLSVCHSKQWVNGLMAQMGHIIRQVTWVKVTLL